MVQYWRAAGMTYLKYSNTCAELVRQALKEPMRSKTLSRAGFAMIKGEWEGGKIVQRTMIEPTGTSEAPAIVK